MINTVINKTIDINTPTSLVTLTGVEDIESFEVCNNENPSLCLIEDGDATMLSADTAAYIYFKRTADSNDAIQLIIRGLGVSAVEVTNGKSRIVNPTDAVEFENEILVSARTFTPGYAVRGGFLRKDDPSDESEEATLKETDSASSPHYKAEANAHGVYKVSALQGSATDGEFVFQLVDTHPELAGLDVTYTLKDGTEATSYYEKQVSHVEYETKEEGRGYNTKTVTETVKVHKDLKDLEEVVWTSEPIDISGVKTPDGISINIAESYKIASESTQVSLQVNGGASKVENFSIESEPHYIQFKKDAEGNAFTFDLADVRPGRYNVMAYRTDDISNRRTYKTIISGRYADVLGAIKTVDGEGAVTYSIRQGAVCSIRYYSEPVDDPKYVWFESDDENVASIYNDEYRVMNHSVVSGVGVGTCALTAYINASGRKKSAGPVVSLEVLPPNNNKTFVPLEELSPEQKRDMNLFCGIPELFAFAGSRLVLTHPIDGYDLFYVITNGDDESAGEYEYELAMLQKDYVKLVSLSETDGVSEEGSDGGNTSEGNEEDNGEGGQTQP